MLSVEEIGGVIRIRGHRLESIEASEWSRCPLPAIAGEIVNAPRARARWIRADRHRIPIRESEIAARRIGRLIAPRPLPLFARRCPERSAVILRFGRYAHAAP